jgi:Kef-type K+ transport system membrane component KefB
VVAIDDAWGLVLFSLLISVVRFLNGGMGGLYLLFSGFRELGGAILVGILLGIPMAYLTGRVRRGEPTLLEALGMVFLCSGIALKLDVSFILASMAMGGTVVNLARHHHRPFSAIEEIELPFMILFFVLAGASLEPRTLLSVGAAGAAYVFFRILGRLLGAWLGGKACQADPLTRRWIGVALLPQAGVALGMALVAAQHFPDLADTILPVVLGATVFFEVVGPVMTRLAIIRAGKTAVPPRRAPASP